MKRLCCLLMLACLRGMLFAPAAGAQTLRWSANPPPPPPPPPTDAAKGCVPPAPPPPSAPLTPPRYKVEWALAGKIGTTVLILSLNAEGTVEDVEVEKSSGFAELDDSAVEAARTWQFRAAVANGVPVGGKVRVPVNFEP